MSGSCMKLARRFWTSRRFWPSYYSTLSNTNLRKSVSWKTFWRWLGMVDRMWFISLIAFFLVD